MGIPEQFAEMGKDALEKDVPRLRGRVAIGGMGGSGIAGRIWADLSDSEVSVVSDYKLPDYMKRPWKFIASSYSGNTEETLTLFSQAMDRGLEAVSITSGGKLLRLSKKHGVPVVRLPSGYQPRYAFPYSFFYLLKMLGSRSQIRSARNFLESAGSIQPPDFSVSGIPVVIGHTIFRSVAYRIATQFNENAKMPAFHAVLPEMNHNLTTGLEKSRGKLHFIIIRSSSEPVAIRERIEATKSLVLSKYRVSEIWASGKTEIEQALSVVVQGDMLSVNTALELREDPMEITAIKKLKQILREKNTYTKMVRLYAGKNAGKNRKKGK